MEIILWYLPYKKERIYLNPLILKLGSANYPGP
jgi:hypothetical protein